MRNLCSIVIIATCWAISCGAQTAALNRPVPVTSPVSTHGDTGERGYTLGIGDQILIRAANAPEISEKPVRIDLNGYINMPMIGRLEAKGLTVEQLEAELTKRLKVYLEAPEVAVSVSEYQSQPVSTLGEVGTPGVHQLQGRKSLVEILALSGGLKPEAGPTVRITRKLEYGRIPLPNAADDPTGKFSVAELELKPLIDAKTPEKDIQIQPYDIISVPKAEFVYIGGDVSKSGAVTLNDKTTISILEALASTGGVLKTADPRKARILRPVPGGKREEVPVDIAKIMNGTADDIQLRAGDLLFVPGASTTGRKAALRAVEAAISTGTMILTYGVIR